jgi:hypothetical protein
VRAGKRRAARGDGGERSERGSGNKDGFFHDGTPVTILFNVSLLAPANLHW